jgi:hypothetical protein
VSSEDGDLAGALSQAGQQIEQLQSAYQQQANLIQENTQALQSSTSSHSSSGGSVLGSITSGLFGGALGFLSPIISGIASLFGGSSAPTPLPIYTPPPPVSIDGVLQNTPASSAPTTPAASQSSTLAAAVAPAAGPLTGNDTATQSGASADGFSNAALGYLSQIASGITSLFGGGSSTSASAQLAIYTPPATAPVSAVPQPAAASPQAPAAPGQTAGSGSQSNAATQVTVNISAMDSQSFMDRSDDIASAVRAAMLNMHPINDVVADL